VAEGKTDPHVPEEDISQPLWQVLVDAHMIARSEPSNATSDKTSEQAISQLQLSTILATNHKSQHAEAKEGPSGELWKDGAKLVRELLRREEQLVKERYTNLTTDVRSVLVELLVSTRAPSCSVHIATCLLDTFVSSIPPTDISRIFPIIISFALCALRLAKATDSEDAEALSMSQDNTLELTVGQGWANYWNSKPSPVSRQSYLSSQTPDAKATTRTVRVPSYSRDEPEESEDTATGRVKRDAAKERTTATERAFLSALPAWAKSLPSFATVYTFMEYYRVADDSLNNEQHKLCFCLADRALLMCGLLLYKYSLVAASIYRLVRHQSGLGWNDAISAYTGYTENQLSFCTDAILGELQDEEKRLGLAIDSSESITFYVPGMSIREKYTDDVYQQVVNLPAQQMAHGAKRAQRPLDNDP
jgi:hypothetical protein